MSEQYIYQVARIRALETQLFSDSTINQLLACPDYESCLRFLGEKGWGQGGEDEPAEEMLEREEAKVTALMKELKVDPSCFEVLEMPKRFHNLKAAIKETVSGPVSGTVYYEDVTPSGTEVRAVAAAGEWEKLPEEMQACAKEAQENILHTSDGQVCDMIIDRACLESILAAGKSSKNDLIRAYAETTVAIADIKIAARSAKTGKSLDFMKRAIAPCGTLKTDELIRAASGGVSALYDYLKGTKYAGAADALSESPSAFERWCDDQMTETLKPQKHNPFTVGPIIAYYLARQNEIKTVRIILSGKLNGLSDGSIRERVREMYV
ncbi:MAG: V0D/AC39 family V-type ATPase subunit [Eubacterium sp.]|jgi:V/A-type H+-transporting ATPase subunit C